MDFVSFSIKQRSGSFVAVPSFKVKKIRDLMVRGRSFYAVWDEEKGLWSRDEADLSRLVDEDMKTYVEEQQKVGNACRGAWMGDFDSGSWQTYQTYLHSMFDTYTPLDSRVTFLSQTPQRKDYVSKRLPYDLEDGEPEAYNKLMGTLYSKEERRKLEWAVGAVLNGDGKDIQKFIVLYGQAGSGKSTFLHILERLFEGYWTNFDAKSLTNGSNFATHFFKDNPLVAIQHDGDLSKIEDNSLLNSIVAHEDIVVNEKFKAQYINRSLCFLFLGTNSPVRITDAKSGLIRRLIDVVPTGELLSVTEYRDAMDQIPNELGKIANKCIKVYRHFGKRYYDEYKPLSMMYLTDPFFNFVDDQMETFINNDPITLKHAYDIYLQYCESAKTPFVLQKHKFRDELRNYYDEYLNYFEIAGRKERAVFRTFLPQKLMAADLREPTELEPDHTKPAKLELTCTESIFDKVCAECPAQYGNMDKIPFDKWERVNRNLSEIDTHKLHYVKPPLNHIVIDFDLKDENGNKDRERNLIAAASWPPTYAEFSQGGNGVHLHYIYEGDTSMLSRVYDKDIEIKVFTGNASLRRKLTFCNNLPIAYISEGLPLKEVKHTINWDHVKDEVYIRQLIEKALRKEVHANTKPNVDFMKKILDEAYEAGITYDISDMKGRIFSFAAGATNQSEYCLKLIQTFHYCSKDVEEKVESENKDNDEAPIIFLDCEVFPNLLLVNWKYENTDSCVHMINPSPQEVEELFHYRIIGFNNRRYDNHILYARYLGWDNEKIYKLSSSIVGKREGTGFFREAYNISYTDVWDFSAKKQSLKKWEIELDIHHQELNLPWNEPVPEERWAEVADYCDNDVKSTEILFHYLKGDWKARQILAKLSGLSCNDTTNQHTTRIIFGNDRSPKLVYTDLATGEQS